jgi:hypothetical protein
MRRGRRSVVPGAGVPPGGHPSRLRSHATRDEPAQPRRRGLDPDRQLHRGGLLFGAAAAGIRRALRGSRGGTWGPILIGSFAACLVWAGVFVTDPAEGFPPGTPDGAGEVSWHGLLHSFAPALAFLALIAACFVFARRFASRGQRGWAAYCLATGIALVTPDLFFGRALFVPVLGFAAVLGWGWVSIVAARLIAESRSR